MLRQNFNDNWQVSKGDNPMGSVRGIKPKLEAVNLLHDVMIMEQRDKDTKNVYNTGYYPGGYYTYVKKFAVPEEYANRTMSIEFEGVYMNALVYVNGHFAGKHPYGYSNFYVILDKYVKYGQENEIKVIANNVAEDNSRWYTGSGIYWNVKLIIGEELHIQVDGVKITTPEVEPDEAVVEVVTQVAYLGRKTQSANLITTILDANKNTIATESTLVTVFVGESTVFQQRIYIEDPALWSVEEPNLCVCHSKLTLGKEVVDQECNTFGIRKLQLSHREGFKINDRVVKLRGACIHHDNGVIGACAFATAEERRVKLLKEAGFNAIRMSHNPISKEMLDACDRLGMLVMNETFDMSILTKTRNDYANYYTKCGKMMLRRWRIRTSTIHPSLCIRLGMKSGNRHSAWRRLEQKNSRVCPVFG